jgi:hypothetical protein
MYVGRLHQNVQTMYLHGNANEGVDDNLPFFQVFGFFKKSILGGISQTNNHMLILNGHGSHVTL